MTKTYTIPQEFVISLPKQQTSKMRYPCILILVISFIFFSCGRNNETIIHGTITNPRDSILIINDSTIRISETGEFSHGFKIEESADIEFYYQDAELLLYLQPGEELFMTFDGNDIMNTIRFEGTSAEVNYFLISLARYSIEVSPWFEHNWYFLFTKNETDFIHIIDSLQNGFLSVIEDFQARHDFSDSAFIKGIIADTYFSFNRLILFYPSQHEEFTGLETSLSHHTIERLVQTDINDPGFLELDHYEDYCKDWIELNLQKLMENSSDPGNYYIRRMDELFRLLPEIFTNKELLDFWLAGYLSGHIANYGTSNSKDYVDRFYAICSTGKYKQQVEKAYQDRLDDNGDHSVEIFKTIEGFHLEAHIFSPWASIPAQKVPGIVIFHGGGWAAGNPSWAFSRARHFARKGMIAVAAQYRLSNQSDITPIEAMEDTRDIIIWMRSKADSLGLQTDSIVAWGWSAGGHLAMAAAIFPGPPSDSNRPEPDALILVSPAVDLYNDGWSQFLLGTRADIRTISPVDNVRKNLPPTIILQGRDDTVTPLKGARLFYDRMIAAGNDCELWIYDEVGHLFTPNTMRDDGWPVPDPHVQQEAFEQADIFLKKRGYLK
ncbi:MAG: alpha/beta hydrolase [Bacteroidales bacterium]|nr:alpha/beta hydrolase [Bacteroidales bacterium]